MDDVTVVEVTGYAGGDDLLNRLRQTWSANVVLDLLADRLTKATREHLIDAGFLRARIEVEVDRPGSDTDRARVRIDPGLRTGSRHLSFRGNQVLATQTLQELTASGRLDANAWKDPAPLIAAIREAYAAKGYLAALVTIGPIEFADDAATLPIRIDEGPAAQVAAVQLMGVAPERRSGALEATALPWGRHLPPGRIAGRARLERYYRDLGFRDARGVDGDRRVAGNGHGAHVRGERGAAPRDQLVEIEGVQSTRPSLVSKAVQLTPGEPASAAAAAATEKWLMSSGPSGAQKFGSSRLLRLGRSRVFFRSRPSSRSRRRVASSCVTGSSCRRNTPRRSISAPTRWAPRRISAIATSSAGGCRSEEACVTNQTCGARERSSRCRRRGARYEPTCS